MNLPVKPEGGSPPGGTAMTARKIHRDVWPGEKLEGRKGLSDSD